MSRERDRAMTRFIGALMIAVGAMIALLTGNCTLRFVREVMTPGPGQGAQYVPFALVIGGAPFAFGVWIALKGWGQMRRRKDPRDEF